MQGGLPARGYQHLTRWLRVRCFKGRKGRVRITGRECWGDDSLPYHLRSGYRDSLVGPDEESLRRTLCSAEGPRIAFLAEGNFDVVIQPPLQNCLHLQAAHAVAEFGSPANVARFISGSARYKTTRTTVEKCSRQTLHSARPYSYLPTYDYRLLLAARHQPVPWWAVTPEPTPSRKNLLPWAATPEPNPSRRIGNIQIRKF